MWALIWVVLPHVCTSSLADLVSLYMSHIQTTPSIPHRSIHSRIGQYAMSTCSMTNNVDIIDMHASKYNALCAIYLSVIACCGRCGIPSIDIDCIIVNWSAYWLVPSRSAVAPSHHNLPSIPVFSYLLLPHSQQFPPLYFIILTFN